MLDSLLEHGSYLGIFLFLVLTGCGLPIPEEVAIVLAGVLSGQGELATGPAYAACLLGALVGDAIMYMIGYRWGHGLLYAHPRIAKFLHAEREARLERAVQQHGFKVLLLARFMVGIRGPAYLAAGMIRMPFRQFLLCDLVAATLVVSLFFGVSYALGDEVAMWIRDAELTLTIGIGIALLVAGIWMYRRRHRPESLVVPPENEKSPRNAEVKRNGTGKRASA